MEPESISLFSKNVGISVEMYLIWPELVEFSTKITRCFKMTLDIPQGKTKSKSCVSLIWWLLKYLIERTFFLGHQLCEVVWPVPFLTAFISLVHPTGPLFTARWINEDTCFVRRKTSGFKLIVSLDYYLTLSHNRKSTYWLKLVNFIFTVYLDHLYKNEDNILFVHIVHAPHSRKYWHNSYYYCVNILGTSIIERGLIVDFYTISYTTMRYKRVYGSLPNLAKSLWVATICTVLFCIPKKLINMFWFFAFCYMPNK